MNRIRTKIVKMLMIGVISFSLAACTGANNTSEANNEITNNKTKEMTYKKKYTNADFYTDGKFNEDVALKAYKEMFVAHGVPFTALMEKDIWVTDFGVGDFENVGMGGIFWVNDDVHNYFAHAIYLLPGQMIPEHAHVATAYAAKHESWMVEKGSIYNFSAIGEETPNPPAIPESHGPIVSKNFEYMEVGELARLKELESFHFMMAGDQGAVVSEWASYHDNDGLRFTNSVASL